MADPLSGTVISERYELLGPIGQGGQAVVYRAEDRVEKRLVAIKVLPVAAKNKELAGRLAREQEAALALAGTSAVAVYDLCEGPRGALCLVMEYLDGEDLEHHLEQLEDRSDRMPIPRLSAFGEPIVETLERAHEVGILHRDLKPANIFLLSEAAGGGVRLLDFGLSRMKSAAPLTAVGTIVGSPSYIAPEVWKGKTEDLDSRVDVYSLGVILFRILSGRLPFPGESLQEKFMSATTAPRPSLHALRPDLPKRIDAWVERALAIDREQRHPSVRALWTELLQSLDYSAAPRAVRPVAEGLVSAWRKATHAFRRFMSPEDQRKLGPAPVSPVAPAPEPLEALEGPKTMKSVPPPPLAAPLPAVPRPPAPSIHDRITVPTNIAARSTTPPSIAERNTIPMSAVEAELQQIDEGWGDADDGPLAAPTRRVVTGASVTQLLAASVLDTGADETQKTLLWKKGGDAPPRPPSAPEAPSKQPAAAVTTEKTPAPPEQAAAGAVEKRQPVAKQAASSAGKPAAKSKAASSAKGAGEKTAKTKAKAKTKTAEEKETVSGKRARAATKTTSKKKTGKRR